MLWLQTRVQIVFLWRELLQMTRCVENQKNNNKVFCKNKSWRWYISVSWDGSTFISTRPQFVYGDYIFVDCCRRCCCCRRLSKTGAMLAPKAPKYRWPLKQHQVWRKKKPNNPFIFLLSAAGGLNHRLLWEPGGGAGHTGDHCHRPKWQPAHLQRDELQRRGAGGLPHR